jgi:hypothetical protein
MVSLGNNDSPIPGKGGGELRIQLTIINMTDSIINSKRREGVTRPLPQDSGEGH